MANINKTKPSIEEVLNQLDNHIVYEAERAKREYYINDQDECDIAQTIRMAIIEKYDRYDPSLGNITTFFYKIIDDAIKAIVRSRNTDKRKVINYSVRIVDSYEEASDMPDAVNIDEIGMDLDFINLVDLKIDLESLIEQLADKEQKVMKALIESSFNKEEAARSIGMPTATFYRVLGKMKEKYPDMREFL